MNDRRLLLLAFLVCVLLLLVPVGFRMQGQFGLAVWNLGHLGIGAGLTFVLSRQQFLLRRAQGRSLWLLIYLLVLAIAALFELMQLWVGRSATFDDIYLTGVGALLCLWWVHPLGQLARKQRLALGGVTLAATLLALAPFCWFGLALMSARLHLPVLADFESWWYRTQWSEADFRVGPGPEAHSQVGWFNGQPDEPPGRLWRTVSFREFPADWRDASGLGLRVHTNQVTRLVLRLEDLYFRTRGGYQPEHRVRLDFKLHPGWNDLQLAHPEQWLTPSGRQLDRQQMMAIHFTLPQLAPGLMLAIDDLVLVRP